MAAGIAASKAYGIGARKAAEQTAAFLVMRIPDVSRATNGGRDFKAGHLAPVTRTLIRALPVSHS